MRKTEKTVVAGFIVITKIQPLHPRIAEHLKWMETDSKYAYSLPDLDQEYEEWMK